MVDSGNQSSFFSQSLDNINSILSINNEYEMTQKISANIPKIFQIFYSFKTKLYSNYISENDINQIREALKFVDNLNLFMEESDVRKFKEKMVEISSILKKRNYDFKGTLLQKIGYTEMTIINHRNYFYRNKYFNDHKGLSEEIEKELDLVNKGNNFDFRLFKQMQNIFWVVKNVIDDKKKAELENRFSSMKLICQKIKEKRKYQSYDDYGNDYIDYKNYSGTYDYNDNYIRNDDMLYYNKSRYDDIGSKSHYYRGGYRKNNYNNNMNNSNRKYYTKRQQEEKEVEIPSDPSYYINKNKEEDLKQDANEIIYKDSNNTNLNTNDNNNNNINGGNDLNNNIENNNMNNNNNNNYNGGVREEPGTSIDQPINTENNENNGGNGDNSNINNNNDMSKNNDIEIITGNNNLTQNNLGNYRRKSKNYYLNKMIAVEVPPPSGPLQENNNIQNENENKKDNDNNTNTNNIRNNTEDNNNNGAKIDNNNNNNIDESNSNNVHNGDYNFNPEIKQYNNTNNYNNKYKNNYTGYKQNIYNKNNYYNNYYNRYNNQNNMNNQNKKYFQIKKRDFVEIEDNNVRTISNTTENNNNNNNTNENEPANGQENEINNNNNNTNTNIDMQNEPNGEVLDGQQKLNDLNKNEDVKENKKEDENNMHQETKTEIENEEKTKQENETAPNKNIELNNNNNNDSNVHNEINGEDKNQNVNNNNNNNNNENNNDNNNEKNTEANINIINNEIKNLIPQNDDKNEPTVSQNQNEEEDEKDAIKESANININDNNKDDYNNNNIQEIGEEENVCNDHEHEHEHINEEEDEEDDPNKHKGEFNAFIIQTLGLEPKGDYEIKLHSSEDKDEEEKEDNNNLGENDLYENMQFDMENEALMAMSEEERANEIEIRLKIDKLIKELNIPQIIKDAEDELEQEEMEKIKNNENKDIINTNVDTNNNEEIKDNNNNNDNNSGHNQGNKYINIVKDMDKNLKNKITDQILNSFKKQQIVAPKYSYYTNNFFKQNPQMFSQHLLSLIQDYKKNSSLNMTTRLIDYIFSKYNTMTQIKENNILQEYLLLKILEIESPQFIWNNMQSFEKRILIPLYQKINYIRFKNYHKLESIYLQYVSGIYKIFQNSGEIIEKIQKYGSFHNTFMVDIGDTDIDICIVPKCTLSTFQNNYLEKLKKGIQKFNLGVINKELINNNYILLKITYTSLNPKMSINVDITVHNMLPIFNSYLIRLYGLFDQRFHIMGIYLKYWAKNNKIHGAQDGFLSSYALLIMIIHFLQKVVEPKILPNLQKIPINDDLDKPIYGEEFYEYYYNDKKIKINYYFEKDAERIKENILKINDGKINEETVTNLLVKFFEYYAYIFESKQKISVHKDLIESIKERDDNIAFSIDDPFEITHNPGKSMIKGSDNYKKFIKAMKKEINLILSGEYVKRLEREKMLKISGTNNKNLS